MWTEVKRRLQSAWAACALALAAVGAAAVYLLRRRGPQEHMTWKLGDFEARLNAANAEAAIKIHVARAKDETVRAELRDITKDKDGQRRRQRLLELERRVRKGAPH